MASLSKWTPRIPIIPKHNIISSDFTNVNTKQFLPEYDKEPEDMQMIMSNAYAKKWHQEKNVFKKRLHEEKVENEVYLMRRYVIRGLNKKMKNMAALRAVPSRVKVGQNVPYAVRLLPEDTTKSKPSGPTSTNEAGRASKHSLKKKKSEQNTGLHVSVQEAAEPVNCRVDESDGRLTATAGKSPMELKKLEETCNHVHVERTGNKFIVHRIECEKNHHHGCDCTEFDPATDHCPRGACRE